ncbi:MAG: hypothetical protein KKH98_08565 [Spirochaetes bacterium]|nr:hypothetical protein [Spirochaetota bacterium]
MIVSSIDLDILEFTAETGEWLAENHSDLKTVEELAVKLEPYDDVPEDITGDLINSIGYYIWMKLRGKAPEPS